LHFGLTDQSAGPQESIDVPQENVFIHPDFDSGTNNHDLALLKLPYPVSFTGE